MAVCRDKDAVIANIRACVLSVKGGIPVSNVNRDYQTTIGGSIPFRDLGYESLDSFLKDIPSMRIVERNGERVLEAKPTEESEHLVRMISRQKTVPKKVRTPRFGSRRAHLRPSRAPRPPVRFVPPPRPRGRHEDVTVTVQQNISEQPAERKVSFGDGNRMSFNGPTVAPRFRRLQTPTSDLQVFPVSSQVPLQNHVTSPDSFSISRTPTPPETRAPTPPHSLALPATINDSMAAISLRSPMPPPAVQPSASEVVSPPLTPRVVSPLLPSQVEPPLWAPPMVQRPWPPPMGLPPWPSPVAQRPLHPAMGPIPMHSPMGPRPSPPQPVPAVPVYVDYLKELEKLAVALGKELPESEVKARHPKGLPPLYRGVVKFDDIKYNSYPDEHPTMDGALQMAAKLAYDDVIKRCGRESLPETQDEDLVISRVAEIVAAHPQAGIIDSQIPIDYSAQFNERLPADWLALIKRVRCPIQVEPWPVEHLNKAILIPCDLDSVPEVPPPREPVNDPLKTSDVVPGELILPDDDQWAVYATFALSTVEVFVRLIGKDYNEPYERLSTKMELHYMEKSREVFDPQVGNYYAVSVDQCWHRVRLEDIIEKGQGIILFIDHGDEEIYPLQDLFVLEPEFAELPAQALQVSLFDLEVFADDQKAVKHLMELVIGNTFAAEVKSRDPISLILYDTSGVDDINVNDLITRRILEDAHPAFLPENGDITDACLSYVDANGDVFLHIKKDSFQYLEALMAKVNSNFSELEVPENGNLTCDPTKLYFGRYSVDNAWYRVSIIGGPDNKNQVMVQFVDYGNIETTPASELMPIEKFSGALAKLPPQAIRVHLNSVPPKLFSKKIADRLKELVPEDETVLVKMVKVPGNNSPPEVDMWRRTEDKQLVSVNFTLRFDPDLMEPQPEDPKPSEVRSRRKFQSQNSYPGPDLDVTQAKGQDIQKLPTPKIPEPGHPFEVVVTMAANPDNFVVQPFEERERLAQLREDMRIFYTTRPHEIISAENVSEGQLFAALYTDGFWYRCTVSNVISGSYVSVYFSDYGDVAVITLDKLQPLAPQFKQLTAQAIKAKLSRVLPIDGDWTVDDCLRFYNYVAHRVFVSIIVDSGPDLLNPSDIVLGLELIDTSGEDDERIDEILVEEGRAKFSPRYAQRDL